MSLVRSLLACFCAIQAGALVVCVLTAAYSYGTLGIAGGLGFWMTGQIILFPFALVALAPGALLRMLLGFVFEDPKTTSLLTGVFIGLAAGGGLFLVAWKDDANFVVAMVATWVIAGGIGGWVWWLVKRPFLRKIGYE